MKKEISLACFGTVLSSFLGYVLNTFESFSMTKMLIILLLAVLIIGTLFLMGALGDMLTPTRVRMEGTWVLSIPRADGEQCQVQMTFKQKGSRVWAGGKSTTNNSSDWLFSISGRIERDRTFVGLLDTIYKHVVIKNGIYLRSIPSGNQFEGFVSGPTWDGGIESYRVSLLRTTSQV